MSCRLAGILANVMSLALPVPPKLTKDTFREVAVRLLFLEICRDHCGRRAAAEAACPCQSAGHGGFSRRHLAKAHGAGGDGAIPMGVG